MPSAPSETEQFALLALSLCPGLTPRRIQTLMAHYGSAQAVLDQGLELFPGLDGWDRKQTGALLKGWSKTRERAQRVLDRVIDRGWTLIDYHDPAYPQRLKTCADAPLILYARGSGTLNPRRSLAVVGSRAASRFGLRATERIAELAAACGAQVVSGMAEGIDAAAHKTALKHRAETTAVMGTGPDQIFPDFHAALADEIAAHGTLLTEYPPGTRPDAALFPKRNRIVAGMADATVVVEAAERSGALITARMANDYGREVIAVPGSWDRPNTRGCNELIRKNLALILTEPEELLRVMHWEEPEANGSTPLVPAEPRAPRVQLDQLEPEYRRLAETLLARGGVLESDALSEALGISAAAASALFFTAEMNGWTRTEPGKRIRWIAS